MLNVGHQYKTWTRDVTQHSKGDGQFSYDLAERLGDGKDDGPTWADDYFYLTGKLEALDAPTEWHYDPESRFLYLWCQDGKSPAGRRVTVKRRTYGICASRRDHVEIEGFRFFATTLRLDQCNHCLVDRCQLRFPVFARRFEERDPEGNRKPEPGTIISGDHHTIRESSLAFSNVGGLQVRGNHCRVENCIVHDVNWGGNYSHPGISLQGSGTEDSHNIVNRCTVYGVGNIGILYGGRANTISCNHVYDTGRACRDIAAVHTGGVRAEGSVAHHNWVHDSTGIGMRGDDQTRGLTFHHNVIWNCARGMIMKGNHNRVYHNTVLVDPEADYSTASIVIPKRAEPKKWWTKNPTLPVQNEDTLVFNNAAFQISDRGGTPIGVSDLVSHNVILQQGRENVFSEASEEAFSKGTFDLRPARRSPLIDAGRPIPDVETDHRGKAPDAGAYEAGGERWIAGADWEDEPIRVSMVVRLEPPRRHLSVPLPSRLQESGISPRGIQSLQTLYDKIWAEDGRATRRAKAIALRERFREGSREHGEHHAEVSALHREVWLLLRDRGSEVLEREDRKVFGAGK